jgi:hypothetical protein
MNFSRDMSKKSESGAQHSLTIKSKVTLSRILEVTNNSLKIEINDKGTITGKYTAKLKKQGAEMIGRIENYEDTYKLCYIRGPEGIILEPA